PGGGPGGGSKVTSLAPRMNQYTAMPDPLGTPDVHTTLKGDIYLSIMNIDGDTVAVNVILTPMVGWIWWAVMLMGAGGIVALIPFSPREKVPQADEGPLLAAGHDPSPAFGTLSPRAGRG